MKDEDKQAALFEATVKTVNEMGLVAASVSKIAREARVSPATLYVYYDNKEDLLVSTYIEIEKNFSRAALKDFDASLPIRDIFRNLWLAMSDHISNNYKYFQFTEQFFNSSYHALVDKEMVKEFYTPIIKVIQKGIALKIIKDVELDILAAFIFYPVLVLSNPRKCMDFKLSPEGIETAFTLAWDAIKL